VPAPAVADLLAGRRTAVADALDHRRAMPGAGASSMIFWWRRCIEQSRSPSHTALRCVSASTWISTCARVLEELLHVHGRVAEGGTGFAPRGLHGIEQRGFGVHHAHAAPAAAAGGLDDHRVADLRARCG
jgi:hypothetical protein